MIQGKLDWNPEIKGQSLALAFSSCGNMEFMISTLTFDRCRNLGPDMKSSIRAPEFHSPSKNQVTKGNTLPFCPLLLLLKHGFIDLRVSSNESRSFPKHAKSLTKTMGMPDSVYSQSLQPLVRCEHADQGFQCTEAAHGVG